MAEDELLVGKLGDRNVSSVPFYNRCVFAATVGPEGVN